MTAARGARPPARPFDEPAGPSISDSPLPHLYVDLDGTLIATDLLHESSLQLLRSSPLSILRFPQWMLCGKAHLKRKIAERVSLDASVLPYRADAWIDAYPDDGSPERAQLRRRVDLARVRCFSKLGRKSEADALRRLIK